MGQRCSHRARAYGAAATIGLIAATGPTPASAFLEFLFGRPAAAPVYRSEPLDVSVAPRRRSQGAHHHKRELGRGAARHAAKPSETRPPKGNRQVAIDPVKNPDWYLTDPNLRRGDILILASGPVVFQGKGQGPRVREDFVSLAQSRAVSSAHLRDLRMMVSGIWTPPAGSGRTLRTAGHAGD